MPPIACILVSDFPLAALIRANPELRDHPVACSEGRGPHAHLSFVAPLARGAGVVVGMTVAQASAIAPDLNVVPRSAASERAAADALADAAESISPIVEEADDGRVYLELGRWGGDAASSSEPVDYREAAAEIVRRVRAVGMEAAVGIASSKELAWIAARCGGVRIIESGQETEFLNWVPLDLLGLDSELEATLARWGIRRLGEMARLDSREIGSRLGVAGADLVRLARGDLDRNRKPLTMRARAEEFVEQTELEYGIEQLEPMSFVMRGILERLTARLKLRGLVAGDMHLALELADRRRDQRRIAVAAATVEVRSMLALLILNLEKTPPEAAVEGIRISVQPRSPRPMQTDMFLPPAPAPDRLQTTLARLAALCGPEHVGALHPQNSHRPEAVELKPFAPPPPAPVQSAAPAPGAINRLMIRTIRPAQEVEVMCARGHPDFVRGRNLCARVISIAGPWRRQGEWWRWQSGGDEPPFARDYYDLALADGGVYRMYRDLHNQKWFVDGVYD